MHKNYNKRIKKRKRKIPNTRRKKQMLKTYEYTHSNNRRAETLEQSANMFFKANPQLKGEWEAKIYAMAANGGGYETDAVPASGYAGRDAWTYTCSVVSMGGVNHVTLTLNGKE